MGGKTTQGRASQIADLIRSAGAQREVSAGELLCELGDDGDRAWLVLSGSIDALIDDDHLIATHGEGAVIGEITALVGGQRTATLRAGVASRVVEVERAQLRSALESCDADLVDELVSNARDRTDRTRVASMLTPRFGAEAATAISRVVTWRRLDANEALFGVGDAADSAFLVVSGRLEIIDTDTTLQIGRGDVVGELGLLDGEPRSAAVRARRSSLLAELSAPAVAELVVDHPSLPALLVRQTIERNARGRRAGADAAGRSIVIADVAGGRPVADRFVPALEQFAPAVALTPASIDAALDEPGIADVARGELGEVRLVEHLHQLEQNHGHLVFDITTSIDSAWAERALERADVAVVLIDATTDPTTNAAAIQSLGVPEGMPVWAALVHPETADRPTGSDALRSQLGVERIIHLRGRGDAMLARLARLSAGRGIGLALSGGGGRGLGHLGVLEALEELDVPIDTVVGTSMGSVIGAVHAQGLIGRARREAVAAQVTKLLDYTLPLVSVISGRRISASIEQQFGGWEIEDTWTPYACVSTSLTHSERRAHRSGALDRCIRASVAIPGVLPPVPVGDELLVDGGVLDNLPVGLLSEDPAIGTVIASDVAPIRGPKAHDDYGTSVSGWKAMRGRILGKKTGYPGILLTLMRSTLVSSTRDRNAYVGSGLIDCYLQLDLRGVGLLEFEVVDEVADRGLEQARPELAAWWQRHSSSS